MSIWNEQLDVIRPYTVASHKIWAVKPEDRAKILKLDWNEAVIPPSPKVREKLAALLAQDDFFHLYPSTYNESLMDALSEYCGLPEAESYEVTELWSGDQYDTPDEISAMIPPHGVKVYRIKAKETAE